MTEFAGDIAVGKSQVKYTVQPLYSMTCYNTDLDIKFHVLAPNWLFSGTGQRPITAKYPLQVAYCDVMKRQMITLLTLNGDTIQKLTY